MAEWVTILPTLHVWGDTIYCRFIYHGEFRGAYDGYMREGWYVWTAISPLDGPFETKEAAMVAGVIRYG